MRFHTYTKFSPDLADAVDLQSLLDKLADYLLQSGFAGGAKQPYYGWEFGDEGDRSMDALREAILNALLESGQFTPEMLAALRGEDNAEGQADRKSTRRNSSHANISHAVFCLKTKLFLSKSNL